VAWHDDVVAWVAYASKVPELWKKYEPMAKARVSVPLAHGKALNAKPSTKRERPETYVNAFAFPPPLPKKVRSSVAMGSKVLPCTVLALRAMKDDAFAPLNCAVTMRPLPGPEVSNNQLRPLPSFFLIISFIYIYIYIYLVILSFIYIYIYIFIYHSTGLASLPPSLSLFLLGSFFSRGL